MSSTDTAKLSLPLVNPGAAGEGTYVLVHPRLQGSVSLWKLQPEAQAVWVRIRASGIGLDRDVFVACVYIPPAGSAQLLSPSLFERMSSLKAAVTSAQAHGHVILGGDINATVAGMNDVLVPDRQFLEDSGNPCQLAAPTPLCVCMATSWWTFASPPPPCLGLAASLGMPMLQPVSPGAAQRAGWIISSSAGTSSPPCSALRWRASVLTPTISRSCSQCSSMTLLQQLLMIQPGLPSPALPYLACNGMVLRRQGMSSECKSSMQPWLSATARSMPISLTWLSSSWVASWFRLLLRQAAGMPPDQGRTRAPRAPRASPILTASAESSAQNSDTLYAMILTVSRSWPAVFLLSSAASAGSTGSSKH